MIRVEWKEPTERHFLCTLVDGSGAKTVEIREGDSEEVVTASLAEEVAGGRIQSVNSVAVFDFKGWKARAEKATNDLLKVPAGEREFKSAIWTELKAYLIWLFHGKCAYCEAVFVVVSSGDVEHYRPKSSVTDADDNPVDHPGYYWLAYNPANLMPSCERCNRAGAKMTRFPVSDESKRAKRPGDPLEAEKPLLLNPYWPDLNWRDHFRFETTRGPGRAGVIRPLTAEGEASIKAYRLQRPQLIDARAAQQESVVPMIISAVANDKPISERKRAIEEGVGPFSAAVLSEFEAWERRMLGKVVL